MNKQEIGIPNDIYVKLPRIAEVRGMTVEQLIQKMFDVGLTAALGQEERRGKKIALFFGKYKNPGHHLYSKDCDIVFTIYPTLPWSITKMDGHLIGMYDEVYTGEVHYSWGGATEYWFAFYWWDHSGDNRLNSHSGFYVKGFIPTETEQAWKYACSVFPEIIARQTVPLTLMKL